MHTHYYKLYILYILYIIFNILYILYYALYICNNEWPKISVGNITTLNMIDERCI